MSHAHEPWWAHALLIALMTPTFAAAACASAVRWWRGLSGNDAGAPTGVDAPAGK